MIFNPSIWELRWKMNNPFSISATVEIWKFIEPPVIKVSDLNVGGKTCYDTWGWFIDTTLRYSKEYQPHTITHSLRWTPIVFLKFFSLSIIQYKTRDVWKTSNGKALKSRGHSWGQEFCLCRFEVSNRPKYRLLIHSHD